MGSVQWHSRRTARCSPQHHMRIAKYLSAQYAEMQCVAGLHNAGTNSASLALTAGTGSKAQKGPLVAVPLAGHLYLV